MARREGRIEGSILCAALLLVVAPAKAYELSGGVGLGGILVGTLPRFTVSPHAAIAWRRESGFSFGVDELCSVLPGNGFAATISTSNEGTEP